MVLKPCGWREGTCNLYESVTGPLFLAFPSSLKDCTVSDARQKLNLNDF